MFVTDLPRSRTFIITCGKHGVINITGILLSISLTDIISVNYYDAYCKIVKLVCLKYVLA